MMKLITVLLFATCLQLTAEGLAQSISISVKDMPLQQVFKQITTQSGYEFLYNDRMMKTAKPVTLKISGGTLEETLAECFKNQPLSYTITNKTVIIKPSAEKKNATPIALEPIEKAMPLIPIKGTVKNSDGKPLAGATVTIKETKMNTQTDDNGNFTIEGKIGQTLQISYVGYETRDMAIISDEIPYILLMPKSKEIDTVVLTTISTGYQKISKERYVGSFSQLDSAAYNRRAGMSIIARLDGTVTGIQFDKKGGALRVRGLSTLAAGVNPGPLIILDEFPFNGDLESINPNDVENITLLKDAAAASIWGARAGNGVIVITTKKGKYNQPLKISLSSNITIQEKPDLYYYPKMNISDEIDVEQYLFTKGFYDNKLNDITRWPRISPIVEILNNAKKGTITEAQATAQINLLRGKDLRRDLDKYVYRNAITQQHYLNLTGGNQQIAYTFSAGYNNALPNIQGSKGSNQFTLSSFNTFRPFKKLELQAGFMYTQSDDRSSGASVSNIYPYAQWGDELGNALPIPFINRIAYLDTAGGGQLLDWQYRPLDEIDFASNKSTNKQIKLNVSANYRFTPWLAAKVTYQYISTNQNSRVLNDLRTYETRAQINSFTNLGYTDPMLRYPLPIGEILNVAEGAGNNYNLRGQFNINKNWNGDIHSLTSLIAVELSESNSASTTQNTFYGFNNDNGTYIALLDYKTRFPLYGSNGSTLQSVSPGAKYLEGSINRFISFISNLSYTYHNRYTVYGSARRDGANVFGGNTNARWKPLWSIGGVWNISKENFYESKVIPNLSIRGSYGFTGNTSSTAQVLPIIHYFSPSAPTFSLKNAVIVTPANPDLRWEQIRTINFGIDFSMIHNRLSGSLEVYYKKSTDLFSEVPFDPTSGERSLTVNSASLKGKGIELRLQSKNLTGALEWNTTFQLSNAQTVVTKVYDGKFKAMDFIDYGLHGAVGKPAYGIASYRWAGLDPLTGDPQGWLNGHVSKDYASIQNDQVENQRFYGSAIPQYSGNLLNSFSWKGFSLSANITFVLDFYYRKSSINYGNLYNSWLGHNDYKDRWRQPGDETETSIPSLPDPFAADLALRDLFYAGSEVNVLKGDNIRLQDLRLQYNWNSKILSRLKFQNLQVFIYANNFNAILWRAESSNFDPDYTGGLSINTAPSPRTWASGLNLTF